MPRDLTFTDVTRLETLQDAAADFVMDEETFRAFYKRTAPGIWAYLTRLAGNPQTADDLLQETFYRFLRADSQYENEAHRRNSLYKIATNVARDARRRTLARPVGALGSDEIEHMPGADTARSTERFADFTKAMDQMKPQERAMLWLAYAEGATHREIADTLGLRAGSMKILLFRARRKLAELLGTRKEARS